MSGSTRRRPDCPTLARRRMITGVESLEDRRLMSAGGRDPYNFFHPTLNVVSPTLVLPRDLAGRSPVLGFNHPYSSPAKLLAGADNQGRILTGKDREGNEWQITVHGPGYVIVTDATPNDGALDDDIDTIQLVGTSLTRTFVTGAVSPSARTVTPDSGAVRFNHLFAQDGVASIILNGFTLARTVAPPAGEPNRFGPEIYLPGGVQFLKFHNVEAPIDLANNDLPMDIVIGDPTQPLTVQPRIEIDSIFNTVFDSTTDVNPNGVPQTTATVNIVVNGQIRGLELLSATNQPLDAAEQLDFPTVGTTGRTAVRAKGIGGLKVIGSARNLTASRGAEPFKNDFQGLDRLGHAYFGGNADAVGLDVNGPIGALKFTRGLGNPDGTSSAATALGTPSELAGYPKFGLLGGLVTARRIGRIEVGPANLQLEPISQNPDYRQLQRNGVTTYVHRPGNALTSAAIVSSGSIGQTTIVGQSQSTEIKSGFHYPSFAAGLQGTRAPSRIRPFNQRGGLIDSVVSATYRPTNNVYGDFNELTGRTDDVAGPGEIAGNLQGGLFTNGSQTALGRRGTGVFARTKIGHLPPRLWLRKRHS